MVSILTPYNSPSLRIAESGSNGTSEDAAREPPAAFLHDGHKHLCRFLTLLYILTENDSMCAIGTGQTWLMMHQTLDNGKDVATRLSCSLSSATDHIMACQYSRRQPSLHISRPLPLLFAHRFVTEPLVQAALVERDIVVRRKEISCRLPLMQTI